MSLESLQMQAQTSEFASQLVLQTAFPTQVFPAEDVLEEYLTSRQVELG